MKRLLIEMHQENLITCDNKQCNYSVKNPTGDPNEDISGYLNKPCPCCGQILLTNQDHLQHLKMLKIINWLNKWFSWIMYFVPKSAKKESVFIHNHNSIKIEK